MPLKKDLINISIVLKFLQNLGLILEFLRQIFDCKKGGIALAQKRHYYHAHLYLPNKGLAIKELAVYCVIFNKSPCVMTEKEIYLTRQEQVQFSLISQNMHVFPTKIVNYRKRTQQQREKPFFYRCETKQREKDQEII